MMLEQIPPNVQLLGFNINLPNFSFTFNFGRGADESNFERDISEDRTVIPLASTYTDEDGDTWIRR
jgi:hypothetical protein